MNTISPNWKQIITFFLQHVLGLIFIEITRGPLLLLWNGNWYNYNFDVKTILDTFMINHKQHINLVTVWHQPHLPVLGHIEQQFGQGQWSIPPASCLHLVTKTTSWISVTQVHQGHCLPLWGFGLDALRSLSTFRAFFTTNWPWCLLLLYPVALSVVPKTEILI